jgi:hypothetical protein
VAVVETAPGSGRSRGCQAHLRGHVRAWHTRPQIQCLFPAFSSFFPGLLPSVNEGQGLGA